MSNFLAIATVTAALSQSIGAAIQNAVPGAAITTLRPDAPGEAAPQPRVNLYLYQVTPNAAWRNAALPTRSASSALLHRPQAALDLHYLLTFYGDDAQFEPQRLLGSTVTALNARPVLSREMIRRTIEAAGLSDAGHFLTHSDLADQAELVKFSPIGLNLEELSKMWSVLFQVPYALSIAYQGSVVLLEADGMPQAALPVRTIQVTGAAVRLPILDRVEPPVVEFSETARLRLQGRHLQADSVSVQFGEIETAPHAVDDHELLVTLPAGLRAGANSVRVVHTLARASDPALRDPLNSEAAVFKLAPRLTSVAPAALGRGELLTLRVAPALAAGQRVSLRLGQLEIALPSPAAPTDTLSVPIPDDVPPGDFLIRLCVDGAESQLTTDASGRYAGPKVRIT